MSFDITSLGSLFEMSRDPMLGLSHGVISFANPTAVTLLACQVGDRADTLFPPEILAVSTFPYRTRLMLAGHVGDLTLAQWDDLTLACFVPTVPDPFSRWEDALNETANTLFYLQIAINGLTSDSRVKDDPKLRDCACRLYQNYYRLKRMHHHLTAAVGLQKDTLTLKLRPVDMTLLCFDLCQTVNVLVRNKNIQVTLAAANEDMTIETDPHWMEVLILNLLSNSLNHVEPESRISLTLSRQGRRVLLAVSDRGCGMEPDMVDALFSGQLAPRPMDGKNGAGLGLMLVRDMAQRFGGTLMMESRPNIGTTVRLSFPCAANTICSVASPEYRPDGMDTMLTELSNVLDKSLYTQKLMD